MVAGTILAGSGGSEEDAGDTGAEAIADDATAAEEDAADVESDSTAVISGEDEADAPTADLSGVDA